MSDEHQRIAIVSEDKCKPKKCRQVRGLMLSSLVPLQTIVTAAGEADSLEAVNCPASCACFTSLCPSCRSASAAARSC